MNTSPTLAQKTLLLLAVIIGGCVVSSDTSQTAEDIANEITKSTANKIDWLTIVGGVTIAFGVAGYLAGNTSAMSIIAAGSTLTAVGLVISAYLAFVTEYRTELIFILIGLGLLCFFIFGKSLLDRDKDGKITWQDIKTLIFKTTPKP
jgi:formate/nitrite transporter FocA (FNT family)